MHFLNLSRIRWFSSSPARFGIKLTAGRGLGLCFLAGFCIRLVPEILAFPHPIGFDAVYYATVMKNSVVWAHWSQFFSTTWLFNAIMVSLHDVSGVDPFLLLKLTAPLLYGLNVAGVFWFARKMLNWNVKLSLLAGGLFSVQLASLRISWDLFRNTLGLGLLLFTLPLVGRASSKRDLALLVLLSLLTVFAHEYAAVTLLAIVGSVLFWHLLRKRLVNVDVLTLVAVLPALCVFLTDVFLNLYPIRYSTTTNVISIGGTSSGRFFFLANYLSVKDAVFHYPTYLSLVLDVLLLFAFLYLSYLCLVWKGFFKNTVLNSWTAFLLVGSFGCLLVPFFALDNWDRWMFMLAYPFTFYAVNGISLLKNYSVSHKRSFGASTRKIKGMLIITVLLGCTYLATPVLMNTINAGTFSVYPTSMHFSFAPTVPYEDVDDVTKAMNWLNANMGNSSCVVLHDAFFQWGRLCLDQTHEIVHFSDDVDLAVNASVQQGFRQIFLVWWNKNIGWYGVQVPSYFVQLKDFGRISIFSYTEASTSGS